MADTRRILFYGDSLTWGWVPIPEVVPTTRYPRHERITGVLEAELGDGWEIVEEALSGRTTNVDDPIDPRLNGAAYLPAAIASHLPLDLVVILLGTNDTKTYFDRSPFDIATGIATLIGIVQVSEGGVGTAYPAPEVLVVAPPPLGDVTDPWHGRLFAGGKEKSEQFGELFGAACTTFGAHFLDAGPVTTTEGADGIHFSPGNNRDVGTAIAGKVREILG